MTSTAIINAVALHYHVRPEQLSEYCRHPKINQPRQVCMYLMRTCTSMYHKEIGAALHRDHSTCVHGIARITSLMERDERVYFAVKNIKAQLEKEYTP